MNFWDSTVKTPIVYVNSTVIMQPVLNHRDNLALESRHTKYLKMYLNFHLNDWLNNKKTNFLVSNFPLGNEQIHEFLFCCSTHTRQYNILINFIFFPRQLVYEIYVHMIVYITWGTLLKSTQKNLYEIKCIELS